MKELHRPLLRWYDRNARDLPWRQSRDPYAIWVSEIMLQQTQVETVKPYFGRFLQRFPTVDRLANASSTDVLRMWEGLGYYRRARQLHEAAKIVCEKHDGQFPTSLKEVIALPGIGRYTAGAILSIAFDQPQPILEGNTIRVYSRLLGYRSDPRSSQGQRVLWDYAQQILPRKRAGTVNQAMMELGSEICVPRDPDCDRCPLVHLCPTHEHGWQNQIPVAARKIQYESVSEIAVIVNRDRRFLIRQCGTDERWAGLWDFPRFALPDDDDTRKAAAQAVERLTGVRIQLGTRVATIKHAVTKYRITLTCYEAKYASGRLRRNADCRWVSRAKLADYPLSVTGRKLAKFSESQ